VTNGGRVLGVTALGKDLKIAQAAAYAAWRKSILTARSFAVTSRRGAVIRSGVSADRRKLADGLPDAALCRDAATTGI